MKQANAKQLPLPGFAPAPDNALRTKFTKVRQQVKWTAQDLWAVEQEYDFPQDQLRILFSAIEAIGQAASLLQFLCTKPLEQVSKRSAEPSRFSERGQDS